MIRVVLADDQSVVRAGFRVFLELAGDIEVVGEAVDGPGAVRLARELAPDVICMDVRMPGGNGLAATREIIGDLDPAPAILVVTTFDLDEYVFGALEAGAGGFVLKDTEPDDLVHAVRRLAAGHGLVDHAVTRRVIAEFARRTPAPDDPPQAPDVPLTPRETEIVRLLARGLSNAEIAGELVVETSTVKSHLGRAMAKIGARDRVQTVVWAYRTGVAAVR
ncbi:response regulator transcription factor [Pseudonocardia parietis]|uniref:DNA-binding NarL/FixJ family response regulator n=1 Tax=Pseudonocardia parietis TaxID=570936 RepID=A0ABS4VPZ1_9PSEU|nr:response regulator transcription factor [Pseudonocardia parietis]MBP2365986.1 DNA-binding NarL/FixJ family response regulator [Pseudonocardia parietis]